MEQGDETTWRLAFNQNLFPLLHIPEDIGQDPDAVTQHLDNQDVLHPIIDEMSRYKSWWALEVLPESFNGL